MVVAIVEIEIVAVVRRFDDVTVTGSAVVVEVLDSWVVLSDNVLLVSVVTDEIVCVVTVVVTVGVTSTDMEVVVVVVCVTAAVVVTIVVVSIVGVNGTGIDAVVEILVLVDLCRVDTLSVDDSVVSLVGNSSVVSSVVVGSFVVVELFALVCTFTVVGEFVEINVVGSSVVVVVLTVPEVIVVDACSSHPRPLIKWTSCASSPRGLEMAIKSALLSKLLLTFAVPRLRYTPAW